MIITDMNCPSDSAIIHGCWDLLDVYVAKCCTATPSKDSLDCPYSLISQVIGNPVCSRRSSNSTCRHRRLWLGRWMHRQKWAISVRICNLIGFVMLKLKWYCHGLMPNKSLIWVWDSLVNSVVVKMVSALWLSQTWIVLQTLQLYMVAGIC